MSACFQLPASSSPVSREDDLHRLNVEMVDVEPFFMRVFKELWRLPDIYISVIFRISIVDRVELNHSVYVLHNLLYLGVVGIVDYDLCLVQGNLYSVEMVCALVLVLKDDHVAQLFLRKIVVIGVDRFDLEVRIVGLFRTRLDHWMLGIFKVVVELHLPELENVLLCDLH